MKNAAKELLYLYGCYERKTDNSIAQEENYKSQKKILTKLN